LATPAGKILCAKRTVGKSSINIASMVFNIIDYNYFSEPIEFDRLLFQSYVKFFHHDSVSQAVFSVSQQFKIKCNGSNGINTDYFPFHT